VLFSVASVGCGGGTTDEGKFVREGHPEDYLQLMADGSFFHEEGGRAYSGTYKIYETEIILTLPSGTANKVTIKGDVLIDREGERWVKAAPSASSSSNRGGGGNRIGSSSEYVEGLGLRQQLMPTANHVGEDQSVAYNTVSPTSGTTRGKQRYLVAEWNTGCLGLRLISSFPRWGHNYLPRGAT